MQKITLDTITEAVINHGDRGKSHPRLYEIYTSLVRHLHDFVREVNLTESELQQGRNFLNQASHHTQEIPTGEIHVLTDLLGISELVELLHDAHRSTESNLEGPLYVPNAPERQMGDRLGIDTEGDSLFLSGRVLDLNGQPIANALIDVWQPNSKGLYDVQEPSQPLGSFRGRFKTNESGKYRFETVVPLGYKVPSSGPCGELLGLLGRHPWRAAHIHFKLSAPEYTPLTTQIFIAGDPHLDSDTTFAVRSAIVQLQKHEAPEELKAHNQSKPFYTSEFDFVLKPATL
ncbi:hydroxyquinol 1,2-dioxygenase [Nostocaceae cyanobacterium CENA357]|uniref:Hydroxyquinol 1,2-dioxygenase n=1 Tax=Atlanticothrix silvestris CENA357 TaxID=1725252 RepID=A0A8J7HH76_9CYAN|nr:dioxygenase [Atlanticothrix silvestris]MBH8552580.1 hydroxyquinol 1,2-dioxygenase [Atlanticothrix silvestris CENA357]